MSGFWIAGIALNVVALIAVVVWAVRAWRQGNAAGGRPGVEANAAQRRGVHRPD